MSEHQFWNGWLRPRLTPYGRFERIESGTNLGVPDIAYVLSGGKQRGISGWLELKQEDDFPARQDTPIVLQSLTKEQVVWHKQWAAAGGRTSAMLKISNYLFFMEPIALGLMYERKFCRSDIINGRSINLTHYDNVAAVTAPIIQFLSRKV